MLVFVCESLPKFVLEEVKRAKKTAKEVFSGCASLPSFIWPRGVEDIHEMCFTCCFESANCRSEDASRVTSIGRAAFELCFPMSLWSRAMFSLTKSTIIQGVLELAPCDIWSIIVA